MKFKVLKKVFMDGASTESVRTAEEIVEADEFEILDKSLLLYSRNNKAKVFAPGVWFEIEPIKEDEK